MKVHSAGHVSADSVCSEPEVGHPVQGDDVRTAEAGRGLSLGSASQDKSGALDHHDLCVVARRCEPCS